MRGKGDFHISVCFIWRITPAYAGKSVAAECFPIIIGDHPRLCGEKAWISDSQMYP